MEEKISVIVPVYNLENYIEKTVDSILHQTYPNLEIILVDDGSTDSSLEILKELEKKDIRIKVFSKENGGVTSARLFGVQESTGEWISFIDGDDLIDSDFYERLLKNATKYNADISHCGYKMVFPSRVDYYYNTGKIVEQDRLEGLRDLLSGEFIEPGLVIKLYKKELFNNLNMDTSIRNMEDLLMNYYLFKNSKKSIYEDFCPYHYMIRKGSAATSTWNKNKLEDPLKVFHIIKKDLENQGLIDIINRRILYQLLNLSTLSYGNQKELIVPYKKKARKELKEMDLSSMNKKTKFMAKWVIYSPNSYSFVHALYARIKGTNKKYEVK